LRGGWRKDFEPDAPFDDLLSDIRDVLEGRLDERAMGLALLGQLALAGYWYGMALEFPDQGVRAEAMTQCDWHIDKARSCMESIWSPI
jgi:hypothetical protein